MRLRISIVLFLFTLISCSEPSKPHASTYQKTPENPPLKEKTLVFALIAPDVYADPALFNHWNTLKKTKGNVHVFAHDPDKLTDILGRERLLSFDPDDRADFSGIKHQASQANISQKMAEVLAKAQPLVLLFLSPLTGRAQEIGATKIKMYVT